MRQSTAAATPTPLQYFGARLLADFNPLPANITLNGSTVSGLAETVGGFNHAQATAANQPTYNATDADYAGKPSMTFDGSADVLNQTAANIVAAGSAFAVVSVAKSANSTGGTLFTVRTGTKHLAAMFLNAGAPTYVSGNGVDAGANITIADPAKTSPFWSIHQFKGSGSNPDIYFNGASQAITSGATAQITETGATGTQIGMNTSGQRWPGTIARILIINGALDAADRAYLATLVEEYGL